MRLLEVTVSGIPTVPVYVRERRVENAANWQIIRDQSVYRVCLPDGRTTKMSGATLRGLTRYWRHCIVRVDNYDRIVRMSYKREPIAGETFIYGRRATRDVLQDYRAVKVSVSQTRDRVREWELEVERKTDLLQETKELTRRALLAESHTNGVHTKYTRETIKERLLACPDILDVRFAGDGLPTTALFSGLYDNNYEGLDSNNMLVTFIPNLVPTPHEDEEEYVLLPPLTIKFTQRGDIIGSIICVHPHLQVGGSCLGDSEARSMFSLAKQNGDIYTAIDTLREFRFGYDPGSPLQRDWQMNAWDFWCWQGVHGFPESEPYMKPWVSVGKPIELPDHTIVGLDDWLQTDDYAKVFHLARNLVWFQPEAHLETVRDEKVKTYHLYDGYSRESACPCGRPCSVPETTVAEADTKECSCHTLKPLNMPPCSRCHQAPNLCRCAWWDANDWQMWSFEDTGGRACDRLHEVPFDETSPVFRLRRPLASPYRGPRTLCLDHFIEEVGAGLPKRLGGACATCAVDHEHHPVCRCAWCGLWIEGHYLEAGQAYCMVNGVPDMLHTIQPWNPPGDGTPRVPHRPEDVEVLIAEETQAIEEWFEILRSLGYEPLLRGPLDRSEAQPQAQTLPTCEVCGGPHQTSDCEEAYEEDEDDSYAEEPDGYNSEEVDDELPYP